MYFMAEDIKTMEKNTGDKMTKTISVLKETLGTVRAGRANPQVLDKITVEYYGVQTPLNQVGSVSVPEPRMLLISVWDSSLLKEVEKAILKSDLGLNPTNDGKVIRLLFPELNEERRKELVKQIKKYSEDAKVVIRNIRRDANDAIKKLKKDSVITEDEAKKSEDNIQKLTDAKIKEIDTICAAKEKDILEI
jgi:ribosome recycling factor